MGCNCKDGGSASVKDFLGNGETNSLFDIKGVRNLLIIALLPLGIPISLFLVGKSVITKKPVEMTKIINFLISRKRKKR
jgi:hypothetical protein